MAGQLYQKINIGPIEDLKNIGLSALDASSTGYQLVSIPIIKFDPGVKQRIEIMMRSLTGTWRELRECLVFYTPPGVTQSIHVDGSNLDVADQYRVGLNIPLANCDRTPMIWYEGSYQLSMADCQGTKNIEPDWLTGPFELDRTFIDQPTLVRVDVPHHVHNPTRDPRILMTLRFSPKLEFIDHLDVA